MVPLIRYSYAGGIPLKDILPPEKLEEIVERTRYGGSEIISLLGQGSAYFAPASSLVEMVEAVVKDKRKILPAVAYLNGEYGYRNLFLGVPVILGGNGIESIIELSLDASEKEALDRSSRSVKNLIQRVYELQVLS